MSGWVGACIFSSCSRGDCKNNRKARPKRRDPAGKRKKKSYPTNLRAVYIEIQSKSCTRVHAALPPKGYKKAKQTKKKVNTPRQCERAAGRRHLRLSSFSHSFSFNLNWPLLRVPHIYPLFVLLALPSKNRRQREMILALSHIKIDTYIRRGSAPSLQPIDTHTCPHPYRCKKIQMIKRQE